MKILNKYGLTSPSIEIVQYSDGTKKIVLLAENRFQSPRYAKRFSYFEELFDNFLINEIQNNMHEKITNLLKEENNSEEINNNQIKFC